MEDNNIVPQIRQVNLENPMVRLLGTTAEVTQQVVAGSSQALNRASETVQGISQLNAQTIGNMSQSLSAQYLAKANNLAKESPWKAIGEGVFKAAEKYYDTKNTELDAKDREAKVNIEKQKDEVKRFQETDGLEAQTSYQEIYRTYQQGEFAKKGSGAFIADVQDKLNSLSYLQPDVYARVLNDAYNASNAFDASIQKQASEAQQKLETVVGEQRKQEYLGLTMQVTSKLANALNSEQAGTYIEWFENTVLKPISEDVTLTPIQRIEVATKMLGTFQEQGLAKKYQNYEEYQRILREYSQGIPKLRENVAQFTADNDLLKLNTANETLFSKFPKLRQFYKAPGDIQEEQLRLRKMGIEQRTLDQAELEKNPLMLDNNAMTALGAGVILDPNFLTTMETSEVYSTNRPLIAQAKAIQDEWRQYNQRRAEFDLSIAKSNEELTRLQVSTVDDVFRLQRDMVNPSGQSAEQRVILQEQYRLLNIPPEVIQQAQSGNAQEQQAARAVIQNQIAAKRDSLNQLRNARVSVVNRERDVLNNSFPNLKAYGLLGRNEAQLRQLWLQNKPSLQRAVDNQTQKIQELKQRNFLNNAQQGQTGNFNPSSQSQEVRSNTPYTGTLATVREGGKVIAVSPLKPFNGMTSYPLTGRWLEQRAGGRRHGGVDYAAPVGTPIISPLGGTVVTVRVQRDRNGRADGYGLYVTVKQDDGKFLRYGHLSAANVKVGQRVEAGGELGKVGGAKGHPTSGRSSGAHLHLEVRGANTYGHTPDQMNPLDYFQSIYSGNRAKPARTVRQDTEVFTQSQAASNQPMLAMGNNRVLLQNQSSGTAESALRTDRPSKAYRQEQSRFYSKNPIPRVLTPPMVGIQRNDPDANYNYVFLAQNPTFRRRLAQVADELGTSAVFLADIIAQESQFTANLMHGGGMNNVGLIGFGRSSFGNNPPANRRNEAIISMNAIQQLDVVKEYILTNTKPNERKRIDTLWASIRMGWNDRNRFRSTFDYSIRPNRGGFTYGQELELLGKYAGRRYAIPNIQRRSSITPNTRAYFTSSEDTPMSNQLSNNGFNFVATIGDNESDV